MATTKKKTAGKKSAGNKAAKKAAGGGSAAKKPAATEKPKTRAAMKKAAKPAATVKTPKKKAASKKPAGAKTPSLTRTVNMGPERGDNSWPPSAKPLPNIRNRAPGTRQKGSPANDSTSGPGGVAMKAGNKGEKGGGKGE